MLQDNEFELGDVIWMDPILCGITDEILLRSAGCGIAFNWVAAGSDKVVLFRELYYEGIIVFFVEGFCIESSCKDWLENETRFFLH